ncbi:MAG: bifunctional hydroxymethylpyrimidine kinase/phosphomethylpyrimidine kinase [Rhodanobacteraceae bacterium]
MYATPLAIMDSFFCVLRKTDNSRIVARSSPPLALVIGGSDSGGGAGIQADLRTLAAFGVHGLCVVCAITAQNTRGVSDIHVVPPALVAAQLEAVFDDFRFDVVKVGMLARPAIVRQVAAVLKRHPRIKLVLDPVLVATTGAALGDDALAAALRRHLVPRANLLTPNWPEANRLLGRASDCVGDRLTVAKALRVLGARAVLLKGGHLPGARLHDLLLTSRGQHRFSHRRIDAESHGTGCTLASAVAAGLASGLDLESAVKQAIDYVQRALATSYRPGKGRLRILDHGVDSAPRSA